jgi:23S rRNA (cytidine1920-2'-O)/16S rRNA (cytidine1409-2'-O)-methyltransferase
MVRRGLARSRTEAGEAIRAGSVSVGGRPVAKASTLVDPAEPIVLSGPGRPFVSRGGRKLQAALDRFEIDVRGSSALDAGASTGGFTDCLLQRGASRVLAVDVGYGQLAWSLRQDPRVTVLERTNVRHLRADLMPFVPDVVVADLSFISLRLVLPALAGCGGSHARFVLLVKPQFEAGPGDVGAGGVVRDPAVWNRVLTEVVAAAAAEGIRIDRAMASPLPGPAGNVEFLVAGARVGDSTLHIETLIRGAVDEGVAVAARTSDRE